jgi:transposase
VIAESTAKCDRLDTQMLLELAGSNLKLPVCHVPDDEAFAVREHLRARADLVKVQTMLKNRTHAVLHRRGVLRPPRMDLFSGSGQQFLQEVELDAAGRQIVERFAAALARVQEQIKASERELKRLSQEDRWRESVALLTTMPGGVRGWG